MSAMDIRALSRQLARDAAPDVAEVHRQQALHMVQQVLAGDCKGNCDAHTKEMANEYARKVMEEAFGGE